MIVYRSHRLAPTNLLASLLMAATLLSHHTATASANSTTTHTYEVYIMAGQSNTGGTGDVSDLSGVNGVSGNPLSNSQTDVLFSLNYHDGSSNTDPSTTLINGNFTALTPGSTTVTGSLFGTEVSFMDSIKTSRPHAPALIKYFINGAGLGTLFNPRGTPGLGYTKMLESIDTALGKLDTAGHTYEVKGFYWFQGESDANNPSLAPSYETNLTELIAGVRSHLGLAELPIVIVETQLAGTALANNSASLQTVQTAQATVAGNDNKVALVDTSDLVGSMKDDFHYNASGNVTIGQRIATAMAGLLPAYTPPVPIEILSNGSFETGDFTDWIKTGAGNFTPTAPSSQSNNQPASDGNYIMVWNGGNNTPNGTLSQSFSTVAGANYTLSFDYQKLAGGSGNFQLEYKVIDDVDSANLVAPTSTPADSSGSNGWNAVSVDFVGTGNSVTLTFTDQSTNGGTNFDGSLDNVSVLTLASTASVADIEVVAPLSGTTDAIFTVQLSSPASGTTTLSYATVDDTALAGTDYTEAAGTLEFAAGETSKTISVPVQAVTQAQAEKQFSLNLSNPVGIEISRATATGTILSSVVLPPSGLTAIPMGTAGMDLTWEEPAILPSGYRVERSLDGSTWTVLTTVEAGVNSIRDTTVEPGQNYSYRVTTYNTVASASSSVVTASMATAANTLPPASFANVGDYGTMWWTGGVRGQRVWHIKTSRYGMTFAADSLNLASIFPLSDSIPETEALVQPQSESFPAAAPTSSLSASLTASDSTVAFSPLSTSIKDSQLVANGKFFQRRWQKIKTDSGPALDPLLSGYEICAWPDRVSIVCRVVPTASVTNGSLQMTLDLEDIFNTLSNSGSAMALASSSGSGYVVLKSSGSGSISVNAPTATITIDTDTGTWNAGEERSVGLVIYPSDNVSQTLAEADRIESTPLAVTAAQTAPSAASLTPTYNLDAGYFEIPLRNDAVASDPDRVERNSVTLSNSTAFPQVARLAFTKGDTPSLAGVTCFLRDLDGNPLGIPVQLSKNWHNATSDKWAGPWFHGLTMLTVPPNTTVQFEAFLVGQNYAGVPSASHAQLSLVGWNGSSLDNQQWDESAIGCWGENLVYDPDSALASAIGTDSRPMLLLNSSGEEKKWTGNYGGCDFLRYYDGSNTRRYQKRIRTRYQRYGPNLTNVIYAGETDNDRIDFQYSTSIYRSGDYVRGRHVIRYDVKSDAPFNRMVFFQMASDDYNYNGGTTHAYGYGDQLTSTADISSGVSTPTELTGTLPWFSTLNCPIDSNVNTASLTGASRGFIIRSWNARINGQDNVLPHFVSSGSRFDIVPPPGVTTLKAGDYVEAVIERVYFGQDETSYYGTDANYSTALQNYGNQHQMVIREAIGNNLTVNVTTGTLETSYPVQIQASNHTAEFSITRGIGYIPVTITGLTDYRSPILEEFNGSSWTALDATTGGGNAWQADYDPESATWQLTINVKLDDAYQDIGALGDTPATRTFRFRQENAPGASVASPGAAIPGVAMPVSIGLSSPDTDESAINLFAVSSDPALIPNQNLVFTGTGTTRTFSFTPTPGIQGTATVTLYVTDANGRVTVQTFPVNVNARTAWESAYLEGITDPEIIGNDKDPDGDGKSNVEEYRAGTDPLDSLDYFYIYSFEPFLPAGKHRVTVPGRAGRAYVLERATDLTSTSWDEVQNQGVLPGDQALELEDLTPPSSNRLFYRVKAIAP
jgi:hypothetical protein